ncbi:MAG TPA: GDSL-type esterase/lipase family protein [Terriglobia bacterium]|nr:GDSL-type esterase/lipase family protein [Terriglobia bacterium]
MASAFDVRAQAAGVAGEPKGSRKWLVLFVVALLVILFNRVVAPSIDFDWLNVIPALAAIYLIYFVAALGKTCGRVGYISRSLSTDPAVRKPFGASLFSPYVRSLVVMLLLVVVAEFSLRCFSYHRALLYERQGDLLFTPVPDQKYIEKISLTVSHINDYGLRGGPVDMSGAKTTVLCLGDSITYGYGVDDQHTFPAELQKALDAKFPGRYQVLNGGVDAYPMSLIQQKFLYLWNRGLRPQIVIVGYSMNEGTLGELVYGDERTKRLFEERVLWKNHLRSLALYNLIVENWARHYYDRLKGKLIPGTNSTALTKGDYNSFYRTCLDRILADLRSRGVTPVFLDFCSLDPRTGRYDTDGPLQKEFAAYAGGHGVTLMRTDVALRDGGPDTMDLKPDFIDVCHMTGRGTQAVGAKVAAFLAGVGSQEPTGARLAN